MADNLVEVATHFIYQEFTPALIAAQQRYYDHDELKFDHKMKKPSLKYFAFIVLLLLSACGGGGGGGLPVPGVSSNNCGGPTIYDSYGYSYGVNYNGNVYLELGDSINMPLVAHIKSGCALNQKIASGALPPGINFAAATGLISGAPTQTGIFSVSIGPDAPTSFSDFVTFRVDPIAPQTRSLNATHVVASGLPLDVEILSMASVDHGAGDVLYLLSHANDFVTGYQLWKSVDNGAHWTKYTGTDLPQPASIDIYSNQFALAANGTNLDLTDAGGTDSTFFPDGTVQSVFLRPRLFRFNGSSWALVAQDMPLPVSDHVTLNEFVHSDGSLWITWGGRSHINAWRSLDGGLTWQNTRPPLFELPGVEYGGRICLSENKGTLRTLWSEFATGDEFGYWDTLSEQWQHSSWTGPQHDWPAAPMGLGVCATLNHTSWVFSASIKFGEFTQHTIYTSLTDSGANYLYPRRMLQLPGLEIMTKSGTTALYGLRHEGTSIEIWKLN